MKQNIPVAIIGLGCFFPKSTGLKEYWRLLLRGEDGITEVPSSHWSPDDFFDKDPKKPDHVYCKRGGFLSPVSFDPTEFGIPPNSMEGTDTSQLLGLAAAKMALADAGYGEKPFDRDRTSVILGATGTQELVIPLGSRLGHPNWRRALQKSGITGVKADRVIKDISDSFVPWRENSFPGLLGNVIAGRISNRLDLGGTNCAVDAACASSMSAIHLAMMELVSGRSDMVVTGGVDTLNDIFMHMCFAKTGILSPTGDARPFSNDADGTVLGEGIGIIVLKRLSEAEKDQDKIYAVIKGVGTGSDGKSQSIYAPRVEGQEKALRAAYANADIDPSTVELVEAHGTGTRVGDEVEYQALKRVFSDAPRGNCALGSVKSMVGHTKAAAGAAGLIKTALALHHKVFPPTLKVSLPDERLNIGKGPFYLNTRSRPWLPSANHPRRAGVSAFGFGGSNFHLALEEYNPEKAATAWDSATEIAGFSGATPDAVIQQISRIQDALNENMSRHDFSVLARETRARFSHNDPCRLVLVCTCPKTLLERLEKALGILSEKKPANFLKMTGIYWGGPQKPGELGFLFPGQGSQYVGMGAELLCVFPEAFNALKKAETHFVNNGNSMRLSACLYPESQFSEKERRGSRKALQNTRVAQPAIGTISLGMLRILDRFGVSPHAVAGHSFGELTALLAAGKISEDDFFKLAIQRGACMDMSGKDNEPGSMLAVRAPLEKLEKILASEKTGVVLANRNSPNQGVLSGPKDEIARMASVCEKNGLIGHRLNVSAAFHSPEMKPARDRFFQMISETPLQKDGLAVFSNTTGKPYPANPDQAGKLLADQIISPVNFKGEIENMYDSGVRVFLEVGPKSVLTGLVRDILKNKPFHAIAMDSKTGKNTSMENLANTLAQLAALGYPADLAQWEEPDMPSRKQRMQIPVSGANIRLERKPSGNNGGRPDFSIKQKVETPVAKTTVSNGSERLHGDSKPRADRNISTNPSKEIPQGINRMNPRKTASPNQIDHALKVVREGLDSMQALQMQTAETHKKFLETQSEASRTLQQMLVSTQRLAEAALGIAPAEVFETPPARPTRENRSAEDSTRIDSIPAMPQASEHVAATNPPVAPAVYENLETPAPARPETRAKAQTPPAATPAENQMDSSSDLSSELEKTMLSVVSDLTGYPVEMLGLEMDIESDLGIDSIKRVEILSALEEKIPNLPPVPPEVMGKAKTLDEVLKHLARDSQDAIPASKTVADTPSRVLDEPDGQITATLLSVVSDLTGYPTEMLGLDMNIESDLGIDSIKRVEILSAVEEKIPNLPPFSPEIMGRMSTLGQILEYISPQKSGETVSKTLRPPISEPVSEPIFTTCQEPGGNELTRELLTVVSDLTGYPSEMLGLDLNIESDLGIDSIKRVEIMSALEERVPGLPPVSAEKMGKMKTLAEILAYLTGGSEPGTSKNEEQIWDEVSENYAPKSNPSFEPSDATAEDIPPYTVERKIIRLSQAPPLWDEPFQIPEGTRILVADTEPSLCAAIVEKLKARGLDALLISPDQESLPAASGLVIAAPSLVTDTVLRDLFFLTQRVSGDLQASGKQGGALFATVTFLDGGFGFKAQGVKEPLQGALAGLTKTAAVEWPEVICRAIDLSPDFSTPEAADLITAEIAFASASDWVEIGVDPQGRWIPELISQAAPLGNIDLETGDVVVVSGGARGVTSAAITEIASRVKPTILLLGRTTLDETEPRWLRNLFDEKEIKNAIIGQEFKDSSPTPVQVQKFYNLVMARREIRENIRLLEKLGATVLYRAIDVCDEANLEKILANTRHEFGPIKAVIHGAGVLEDRLIKDKNPEQFDRVFGTKVTGLQNLLDATADDPVKYLVLFSSVAARFGNLGQSDYAMANEALNKIAQAEAAKREDCRVISINWGPWDGGMVSPALKSEFARRNIELIPLEAGANCLIDEMQANSSGAVEVVYGASLVSERTASKTSPAEQTENAPKENTPKKLPAMEAETPKLSLTFKRDIDIHRYPILESHILGGKPVVPFALMTEWMGYGALHENPGLMLQGLDDIRLLTGIRLDRDKRTIRLMAGKAKKKGPVFEVDVEIRDGYQDGREVLHTRARAILGDALPKAPIFDKSAFINSHAFPRGMDDIYETILFHGGGLRGIKKIINLGEKSMVAEIASAPAPGQWMQEPLRSRWIADPLVLDSAFQMAIIWSFENKEMVCLPSFAKSYRQYRPSFPSLGITAVFEVTHVNERKIEGDFTFLDEKDHVVARLSGYEAIMDPSLMAAFKPQTRLYASA